MSYRSYIKFFVIFFIFLNNLVFATDGIFRASVIKVNITPDFKEPVWLAGYSERTEPGQGIHNDIFMKVLALDDGTSRVFIVSTDLIDIEDDLYQSFVKKMEQESFIKKEQLLWTCTNTHSAPLVTLNGRNPKYSEMIQNKLIECLKKSQTTLEPAKIGVDFGRSFMNINRRGVFSDGKVHITRNPYGIVDREVGVIKIEKENGSLLAVLLNYPCHGTALFHTNKKISGDAPQSTTRYLEEKLGNGVTAIYLNGASGDVDPIYSYMRDVKDTNFELDILGIMLGNDVLGTLKKIETTNQIEMESLYKIINLPRKESEIPTYGPVLPITISIVRLNEIALVAASVDAFNEIGMNIKHMSPYARTFFIGHCNGASGYIPTKTAFAEGGFEVEASHTTADGEWLLTQHIVEELRKMKSLDIEQVTQ